MALLRIMGLTTCDTSRKARKDLTAGGNEIEFRDLRDDPLGRDDLQRLLGILGPGLLNRASTTWRGLSEAEKAQDPLELLLLYPTLIKRPVIESADRTTLGWSPAIQAQWQA